MADYQGTHTGKEIDDSINKIIDLGAKITKIEEGIGAYSEELYMYGVEWDTTNSNPDVTRIGNMALHKSLPIHNRMRGCLLSDNGVVNKYLNASDWSAETLDGSLGQVMVELPEFWWKFETDGTTRRVKLATAPIVGYAKVPKRYVSAYEAAMDRTNSKLCSVMNTDAQYRGGNNKSDWDGTYHTLCGMPATSISLTNFRNYARNRNTATTAWNCNTYDIQKELYWLFVVEFATRNSQKAINAELTTEGYRQGGLGNGVSTADGTKWNNFNSYNPFVPCGYTNSLGNGTGEMQYDVTLEDGTTSFSVKTNRYRGIENPFAHIWKWTDGIRVKVQSDADGGESQVYVCHDPSKFQDSNYDGYNNVGNEPRSLSYIQDVIFGDKGEIMSLTNGGGSTTYYCDYHYVSIPSSTALRGVLFGGAANDGSTCGFACSLSRSGASDSTSYFGSRLCFLNND